jgi:hypothetical protein
MKNRLWIDFAKNRIMMDRTFAEKCRDTRSAEYEHLQRVRQDYPEFTVQRREINKNTSKETYAGLTYAYMERYIAAHESAETLEAVLEEYNELRLISECHKRSRRYPTIKKWFLDKYPQISEFGMQKEETAEAANMEVITGMAEQPSATQKMAS